MTGTEFLGSWSQESFLSAVLLSTSPTFVPFLLVFALNCALASSVSYVITAETNVVGGGALFVDCARC